jgi:hypothetical protein
VDGALEEVTEGLEGEVVAVSAVAAHLLEVGGDGDAFPGGAVLTAGAGLGVEHEGAEVVLFFGRK